MLNAATAALASAARRRLRDKDRDKSSTPDEGERDAKPRSPVPNWKRNSTEMRAADVRVNRSKHAVEAAVDRCADAALRLELLLDALEDQHVRVDAVPCHTKPRCGNVMTRHIAIMPSRITR